MLRCKENAKKIVDISEFDFSKSILVQLKTQGKDLRLNSIQPSRNNKPQFVNNLDELLEEYVLEALQTTDSNKSKCSCGLDDVSSH